MFMHDIIYKITAEKKGGKRPLCKEVVGIIFNFCSVGVNPEAVKGRFSGQNRKILVVMS